MCISVTNKFIFGCVAKRECQAGQVLPPRGAGGQIGGLGGLVRQGGTDEYGETYFRILREKHFCRIQIPKEIQNASAICELSSCEWALPTWW